VLKDFMSCGLHFKPRPPLKVLLLPFFLALGGMLAGCARNHIAAQTAVGVPFPAAATAARAERIRTDCIQGRRLICGRVLKVSPAGLVVDSGYTDLLRSPLGESWLIPGTATARRDPNVLELNEPGAPCIGLVFLTDISKRRTVKPFDYVVLIGYPAGQYTYTPVPGVEKQLRKFAAGLDTAVRLTLKAEEKNASTNVSAPK
jgi:hypothetical protein